MVSFSVYAKQFHFFLFVVIYLILYILSLYYFRRKTSRTLSFNTELLSVALSLSIKMGLDRLFGFDGFLEYFSSITAPTLSFAFIWITLPAEIAEIKEEEARNAALLKDAVKTALDERDAKKAPATDKGAKESLDSKA